MRQKKIPPSEPSLIEAMICMARAADVLDRVGLLAQACGIEADFGATASLKTVANRLDLLLARARPLVVNPLVKGSYTATREAIVHPEDAVRQAAHAAFTQIAQMFVRECMILEIAKASRDRRCTDIGEFAHGWANLMHYHSRVNEMVYHASLLECMAWAELDDASRLAEYEAFRARCSELVIYPIEESFGHD